MNPKSAKTRAAGHLFWWTLRKNALIIGAATALSLFMRPGLLLLTYYTYIDDVRLRAGLYNSLDEALQEISYSGSLVVGQLLTALIACILIMLLSGLNFRYLHDKHQSDLFHALPMKRTQLLLTRFAATVTGAAIPIVLSGIGQAVIVPLLRSDQVTLTGALYTTLLQLLLLFAASAMSLLFCVLAGNTFDLIGSLLIVNGGWIAIYGITNHILSNFLIGFVPSDDGWFALSPFARLIWLFDSAIWWGEGAEFAPSVLFVGYWLIFGAVMLILAILLIRRRRNEAAGQPFAYKGARYLSMGIVSIIAGYLLGSIFSSYDTGAPEFYLFFIVGAFLGAVIYGAVATRGFKTLIKSLITGGVCAALFIAIVLTAWFDPLGYSGFVPKADGIDSVTVDVSVWLAGGYESTNVTLTDPENIAAAVDVHQAIIDNPHLLRERTTDSETVYYSDGSSIPYDTVTVVRDDKEVAYTDYTSDTGGTISFSYKTKSGMTVERQFSLEYATPLEDKLLKLVTSREYIEQSDPALEFEALGGKPVALSEYSIITHTFYSSREVNKFLAQKPDRNRAQALYEAYKQDLATITPETKSNEELYQINFYTDEYSFYANITRAHKNVLRLLGWEDFDVQTDPLLGFEARGEDFDMTKSLRFLILTDADDEPTEISTDERPDLIEKICDAYKKDVQAKNFRFYGRTLCYIQFYTLSGQLEFELKITAEHENTLALLRAEGFDIDPAAPIVREHDVHETPSRNYEVDTDDTRYFTEIRIRDNRASDSTFYIAAVDRPELAEKIVQAYDQDMRAEIADRATTVLGTIRLLDQHGNSFVTMYLTSDCTNTRQLLADEDIVTLDPEAALVAGWGGELDYVAEWNAVYDEVIAFIAETDTLGNTSGWWDSSGKAGVMSYNFDTEQWESDTSAPIPIDDADSSYNTTTSPW